MTRLRRALAHIDDVGEIRAVSVLRILLGPIVLLHLQPFLERLRLGVIWSDRFHEPWVSWYPEPGRTLSAVLLWTAVISAAAMSVGLLTRLSTLVTLIVVTHNLFLSTTHYSHNRAFLAILLVGVTVLPSGRHLSVDASIRRLVGRPLPDRSTPLWPLLLLRFEVVSVYLASGTSKLIDADWWGGRVLQLRAIDERQTALAAGAPAWILDLAADGTFQWWFSKAAVLTELFIGFGLLSRRTRLGAVWAAIVFHIGIQISASVQVFSWAALAALCIWVTPTLRDRTLVVPEGNRGFGRMVRALDWFGRFSVTTDNGARVLVEERPAKGGHSRQISGRSARVLVLSRLPVTAWIALPVVAVQRQRLRRDRRVPPRRGMG